MGFLCCRRKAQPPSPTTPTPPRNGPKLSRRRSAPRARTSRQNIEQFYREGKELLRAEQEEQERNYLRAVLREEQERGLVYDEDARDIKAPLGFETPTPKTESGPSGNRSAADSMCKASSNRRYSFETTTDRMGVRLKGNATERTELLSNLHTPGSSENLQYAYREPYLEDAFGAPYGDPPACPAIHRSGRREYKMSGAVAVYPTNSDSSARNSTMNTNNLIAAPYNGFLEQDRSWASTPVDPDQELTPKVSRMLLNSNDTPHAGLSRPATVMKDLPKIDADMIRAAASDPPRRPATSNNKLGFPSEEIFARLPGLLKASTSTFFGSNSSYAGRGGLSSPASDEAALHHKFSQQSLRQTRAPSKEPSMGTVSGVPRRIDSASSFYPSPDVSQCQSLQDSQVDFPGDIGFTETHASTMPRMYGRRSIDRLYRVRSSSSFGRAEDSPGFSRFNFPWNGESSPARTLVRVGSVAEIVPEEETDSPMKVVQQLEASPGKKKGKSGPRPQKRTSSSRAITGMINFVKAGVTGEDYSSSSSGLPSSEDLGVRGPRANLTGSMRTGRSIGRPSNSSRSKSAVMTQGSAGVVYPDHEGHALRRSLSFEGRPSGLRHVASGETEESLGRFDHIGDSASVRSRKPTLRKSFTSSMLKIKEKVSISGFRTVPRAGGIDPGKQLARAKTLDTNILDGGDRNVEYNPSFPQKMATIRSWDEGGSGGTTLGTGRVSLRRSNTAPSRRPSTAGKSVYNTRRSTAYDDCVIFPFADGGDDAYGDEFACGGTDGTAAFRPPSFQVEEYTSEREFWRSRSAAVDVTSRGASIGMAH